MAEVWFHPEAQAEYEAAFAWYQGRSRQAADRFEVEFDRTIDLIISNPTLFPLYDDLHRLAMVRRYPFSLVYQVLPERIYFVAVAHTRRRPGYWRGMA